MMLTVNTMNIDLYAADISCFYLLSMQFELCVWVEVQLLKNKYFWALDTWTEGWANPISNNSWKCFLCFIC